MKHALPVCLVFALAVLCAGGAAYAAQPTADSAEAPSTAVGPANFDDLEVDRAWRRQILEQGGSSEDYPGVVAPMLSTVLGVEMRIPHTLQIDSEGRQANLLSLHSQQAGNPNDPPLSSTGHPIDTLTHVRNPHRDLHFATGKMSAAAGRNDEQEMREAAEEALDVLLGRTEGRIYDGFPLLNFNRWKSSLVEAEHFTPDSVPGEYKMKVIQPARDAQGNWLEEPCWNSPGETCHVWEIDVHHLWYGQQFDSDTFLLKIPYEVEVDGQLVTVDWDDTLRINWSIYSLVEEDFAPTQVMREALIDADVPGPNRGGTVRAPFKGEDTVWQRIRPNTVTRMTVQHTALRFIRGVYTWGWNVHPPRIQFIQPIFEIRNEHTGEIQWDWQGESFAYRNREELTLDAIGEAAPEMKLFRVAHAAAHGATPGDVLAMLEDPAVEPGFGTWRDWIALMEDQRQLPPEARAILADEGKSLDDYDFVTVFLNNEMYGEGPQIHTVRPWSQGEVMTAKLINLDRHTHYFRNVGFGAPLHNDYSTNLDDGIFSFEIMNFKPLYGAPKLAEMQWRAGFGFRPHYGIIQQPGVFPRASDRRRLKPYVAPRLGLPLNAAGQKTTADRLEVFWGYQFSNAEQHPFPFNPPPFIIDTTSEPAFETMWDLDKSPHYIDSRGNLRYSPWVLSSAERDLEPLKGRVASPGLTIGQTTEGWGVAQMCPEDPWPGFCQTDFSDAHPLAKKNWPSPADPSVPKTELRFPPFLRNPAQGNPEAGDIIAPTTTWEPFLFLNPNNGTIFNDPDDPSKGFWTDQTYAHGRTVFAGDSLDIEIEMPRAAAQLFYQFDDLFHDNAIFSPHPVIDSTLGSATAEGEETEPGESANPPIAASGAATAADPSGDTLGTGAEQPDLTAIGAATGGGELVLDLSFAGGFSPPGSGAADALGGYIDLDIDQSAATGDVPFVDLLTPYTSGLGTERFVDLFSYDSESGDVEVVDDLRDVSLGRAPITFTADGAEVRIPTALLADDGSVHASAVVGTAAEVTDAAPNGGFVASTGGPGEEPIVRLTGDRFAVFLTWRDFFGNTGSGRLAVRSDDSAVLYFFRPDNWELMVKVLDGCSLNDRFWAFIGATTTVEYTLTIVDTQTQQMRVYPNELQTPSQPVTDTAAFDSCP